MSSADIDRSRRQLLCGTLALVAGLSDRGILAATELPRLSEADPTAASLSYHHDARQAPRTDKLSATAAQQFCHNCRFVQADSGSWRPCRIFTGKAVNADGWCLSWSPRTGLTG